MVTKERTKVQVTLPRPHLRQEEFVHSDKKRIVIRAGRRGGKTVGIAIRATERFLQGRRQLYAAPTSEQVGKFWYEVTGALAPLIRLGVLKKNESEQYIEKPGTEQRIKAKTAWNADTLRGDYADDLYLDEWQLMNEDTWGVVGAPMLLDNNGDAVFIYTPPSLRSSGVSKAHDPRHAAKMFKAAQEDTTGRWLAVHFTSHDNPHISKDALQELIQDMSKQSYRQEILAEDDEIQLSWLVYRAFNESIRKIPRFEIPASWPVHSGHDFGTANPAALFVAQVKLPLPDGVPLEMRYGDYVVWSEYLPGAKYSTAQHVDAFKHLTARYSVKSSVGGSLQEAGWRGDFTTHGWSIRGPQEGMRHVGLQVERVIAFMELNKVWVIDDLTCYLEEIMDCLWKRDSQGVITNKIEHEEHYHLCACARYLFSDFTPETVDSRGPISKHSSFRS